MTTEDTTLPMTPDEALSWLRLAVETQGRDFVYCSTGSTCFYLPQPVGTFGKDDPRYRTGCLIGVAMQLAGRTITASNEGRDPHFQSGWNLSYEAASVLFRAQSVQDVGGSWGHALDDAVEYREILSQPKPI